MAFWHASTEKKICKSKVLNRKIGVNKEITLRGEYNHGKKEEGS